MKYRTKISLVIIALMFLTLVTGSVMASNDEQVGFATPILVVNTSFLNIRTGPSASFSVLTTVVGGTELSVLGTVGDGVWYQVSTAVGVGWVNVEFTLPRGDFTAVPLVRVTNVPSNPVVIQQSMPSVITANAHQVIPVAPSVTTTTATTVASNQRFFRAFTINPSLDVHFGPDITSGAITTIYRDDSRDYAITGQTNADGIQWVFIEVPGAGGGWVDSNKIKIRFSRTTSQSVIIAKNDTQLRLSPGGGNSATLPMIQAGDDGLVLDISADGKFIKIELTTGQIGWVPWESVEPRTGTPTDINPLQVTAPLITQGTTNIDSVAALGQGGGGSTEIVTAPIPIPQLSASRVVINTSFLNIRSGPGSQYTVLYTASGSSEFEVLGISSDGVWFLVRGPFGQGWVNNEFVLFRGNIESVPIISGSAGVVSTPIVYIGSSAQLYAAPGTDFGLLGAVSGPVEAPIVARTPEFDWIQINTSAGFGWVLADQVIIRGDASLIPIVGG